MSETESKTSVSGYAKAKDLKVVVKFEIDPSPNGIMRVKLAKEIICQLIMLGHKKGRPSNQNEELNEAA
jgi:hypothetical protein